jgi:tRNA/tmRNA/rRNA uracil-C5-methylase (TrmA/RlmC/RlmD family)
MNAGDELTIEPTELVAGGAALARIDGFPIFTANLYPGDVAAVRLTEVKKGFARAEVMRVIRPSDLRRTAPCPIAEECGGCDWTSLRLDAQLEAKKRILTESMRRIGKINTHPPIAMHPSPLNYRLRSRLHRQDDAIGFYAMGSHRVVPLVRECEVVGVETAQAFGGGQRPSAVRTAEGGCPPLSTWEVDGKILTDERELTIRVDQFVYRLSTSSFFQVNRHLLSTMLDLVSGHAARVRQKRVAVDLYAGVGFFTLPLARIFEQVIAVEGASAKYTRENAPPNVEVVDAPVEHFDVPVADFIFLDPPRAGTRRDVVEAIAQRAREMICYLSCDPVTFSRDASRLIASGWRLATLDLLDLFPNTHHVETLASFERAE